MAGRHGGRRDAQSVVTAGDAVPLLAREAGSLAQRLRLWTPARWAARAAGDGADSPSGPSRADAVHHLAQSLVDLAGEAPVALPRLDSDLLLPDQLAVAADDLVRSGPDAEVAVAAVAHLLLHRAVLLGESVPAALVRELGAPTEQELLRSARTRCALARDRS